jgi:hypothetical protein
MMRSYFDASQAPQISIPTANTPNLFTPSDQQHHVDHFIETQHAIRIFMQYAPKRCPCGDTLFDFPIGEFLRLSQFMSDGYNLCSNPSSLNSYKSRITGDFRPRQNPSPRNQRLIPRNAHSCRITCTLLLWLKIIHLRMCKQGLPCC